MHVHLPRRHASQDDAHGSRAWVWFHQFELDRELAGGADPNSSRALQTRARQLTSPHFRSELIAQLDCAQRKAEHPPYWRSASLPVRVHEILAARPQLEALREALCDQRAPSVQGLATAACLINDPTGPMFHQHPSTIGELASAAIEQLTSPRQRGLVGDRGY